MMRNNFFPKDLSEPCYCCLLIRQGRVEALTKYGDEVDLPRATAGFTPHVTPRSSIRGVIGELVKKKLTWQSCLPAGRTEPHRSTINTALTSLELCTCITRWLQRPL
jgi:hypothetical protein